MEQLSPGDMARAFSRLSKQECNHVLLLPEPEYVADILEKMVDVQSTDILEDLPVNAAASIIEEMESDRRDDLLAELDKKDAEAILQQLYPAEVKMRAICLNMIRIPLAISWLQNFFVYPENTTVGQVQKDLHKKSESMPDSGGQYVYVVSDRQALLGVLRLRDRFSVPVDTHIKTIMIANPVFVFTNTPLQGLTNLLERYPFWGFQWWMKAVCYRA